MTTNGQQTTGKMRGGVRRRGKTWTFTLYLGLQPAQRCTECEHREWIGAERLEACPKCGGELRDVTAPRQFTKGGYPDRETAVDALAKWRLEYRGNAKAPELLKPMTLATFLRDQWVPKQLDPSGRRKQTTKESQRRHVERHLIGPASQPFPLGMTKLRELTTEQIAAHYAKLREGYVVEDYIRTKYGRPRKDRKTGELRRGLVDRRGLSENSVRRVHATLHVALAWAVEKKFLLTNPATGAAKDLGDADAPKREVPAWGGDELSAFLASQSDSELWPLWHVLAFTGMRRGEALGLQWRDVDLDAGELTVRQTRVPVKGDGHGKPGRFIISSPKTKRSRTIELDSQTVEVLRSVMMRSVSPTDFSEPADRADRDARWVFADAAGEPLNSNSVSYRWRKAVEASRLRHIPLHGLRHTHATFLLSRGVPVHIVSARLGHADTAMTLRVYAWCLPKAQQAAVRELEMLGSTTAD